MIMVAAAVSMQVDDGKGGLRTIKARFSFLYSRQADGRWLITEHHNSVLPEPEGPAQPAQQQQQTSAQPAASVQQQQDTKSSGGQDTKSGGQQEEVQFSFR
jgi:hypothetical protein